MEREERIAAVGLGIVLLFGLAAFGPRERAASSDHITQFGITWTFDHEYEYGQFANGDYWVVGPATIIGITPSSVVSGTRIMNGSMLNPSPRNGQTQGYDSAMYDVFGPYFDPALDAARPNQQDLSPLNPLMAPAHSSLVSTIGQPQAGALPQLQTAAILTIVEAPPPAGSFRPPYSGSDKTIRFNKSQLDHSRLRALTPPAGAPALAAVERAFQRPWLDHVPNWPARFLHPAENMPDYGREMATQVGIDALTLHLNFSAAQKETLLVRYVQLGIDLYASGFRSWDAFTEAMWDAYRHQFDAPHRLYLPLVADQRPVSASALYAPGSDLPGGAGHLLR